MDIGPLRIWGIDPHTDRHTAVELAAALRVSSRQVFDPEVWDALHPLTGARHTFALLKAHTKQAPIPYASAARIHDQTQKNGELYRLVTLPARHFEARRHDTMNPDIQTARESSGRMRGYIETLGAARQ